ncbi:NK-tumor recognition protein isoform X4 [Oncorhynchus keta]|uniref:NK-tumor recognition protein isoform X4 n=1 Tax=Oncorhynchus keta TaxID=8018 RepID=UPI00227B03F3|nr:NK-tumor recognition protein isoform X4 [Oncorhynchus keta]
MNGVCERVPVCSVVRMGVKERPQCYFDVEINREPVGRIVYQLFSDVCPKTSKNFLSLCTGERGTGKSTGKKLCFKGSTFHRVVKNFMIQGGDFTEGNGRGGESIYGGYFEDENFILKHDRAFLLSMANRGKHTNGSQFFITTKTAPHLDGVHVVFGLVISGFEVIKRIEGLKTDGASRPYADVRVMDCGQLITKSANDVLEGKRKRRSHSADSSLSSPGSSQFSSLESGSESEEKHHHHRRKRHSKSKRSKKRRREREVKREGHTDRVEPGLKGPVDGGMVAVAVEEEGGGKEQSGLKREKPVVRPEEIPPVPENRFLLRRDQPGQEDHPDTTKPEVSSLPNDLKQSVTKSGRKIKGRGTMRYHTPTCSKSHSASEEEGQGSSETPPHWKEEMQRTKTYQPPSVERWSRGDNRWEGDRSRSDSPWSQSPECSSGHSSDRSSQPRPHRKEKKKAKRKKAKKRKHAKRQKKESTKSKEPKQSPVREGQGTNPGDIERRSLSVSRTPSAHRRSPRKQCSGSGKRRHSSPSSRDSSSYTPSRSRSRGRSVSYSQSRSLSHSRSRSLSMSRSTSRSRSRSRYRSRSRSLSRLRRRKPTRSSKKSKMADVSKLKPDASTAGAVKGVETKATALPATPAPENAPVIPMSDSPPPSRWKPGQKPWKPSYVRVQEVKTKTTPACLSPIGPTAPSTSDNHPDNSHLEKSRGSKSHRHQRRSPSGSYRSRSYSRSHSHSRSHSRSRIRSPGPYYSRSSSYSRSDSYDSHRRGLDKTLDKTIDKGWKQYYSSLKRIKNLDKYLKAPDSQINMFSSDSEDGTDSEHSPGPRQNGSKGPKLFGILSEDRPHQETEAKSLKPNQKSLEEPSSRSEWDSDGDKLGRKTSLVNNQKPDVRSAEIPDQRLAALAGWDSESDSEKVLPKMATTEPKVFLSEKEEGEASSESEHEHHVRSHSKMNKAPGTSVLPLPAPVHNATPLEGSPEKGLEAERHKSRKKNKRKHKRKRRSSAKSGSHRSKVKSKRSKRKHQKLKETFHWQPPMEFGEDEEEDESQKEKRLEQQHTAVKDSPQRAVRGRPGKSPCLEKEDKEISPASPNRNSSVQPMPHRVEDAAEITKELKAKPTANFNPKHSKPQDLTANLPKMDQPEMVDDMEICTPEHDLPDPTTEPAGLPGQQAPDISLKTLSPLSRSLKKGDVFLSPVKDPQCTASLPAVMLASGEQQETAAGRAAGPPVDPKWKPLKGMAALQAMNPNPSSLARLLPTRLPEHSGPRTQPQEGIRPQGSRTQSQGGRTQGGVSIQIKSQSRVRPGSLFDEVRKTARLNQRPRNQDSSSSEERSQSAAGAVGGATEEERGSRRSRSGSSPSHRSRGRSPSSSRSRNRSRSSSYSSRSRSRSRRRYPRGRSQSRSITYRSYNSHSRTSSRSNSRSRSYDRRRRSRSDSYDTYSSRSRSRSSSRRRGRRSDSYRSSRSYHSSSRSSSRHWSHSGRYS